MDYLSPSKLSVWLMLLLTSPMLFADVVVVVSVKNPIMSMTSAQVAHIFLGKSMTFPNEMPAMALDITEDDALRNEFYRKVTGKTPAQLNAYWAKIIFAGDGLPPKAVTDGEVVKKFLSDDPRFIGYLERSALDGRVKIICTP